MRAGRDRRCLRTADDDHQELVRADEHEETRQFRCGSALQIIDHPAERGHVVLDLAERNVAVHAKQPPVVPANVAVIDVGIAHPEVIGTNSGERGQACGAGVVLLLEHPGDVLGALESLQALHENIIHSISSGLITTGLDGRITLVNAAALRLLERIPEELMGSPVNQLFLDSLPRWNRSMRTAKCASMRRRNSARQFGYGWRR